MEKEKQSILVVNADKYIRDTLKQTLDEEYNVFTSASFLKALELFRQARFNTVITEINTSEAKGMEIISKLKEAQSDIPIIVITTHGSVNLAVEAMKAGVYDYITRPFNLQELKLIILHALERKKIVEETKEKKIYHQAGLLDTLTGIYNRACFEDFLQRETERAKRYPQKFSLLMIDIDDFRKYNERYGMAAGDSVLQRISSILMTKTRRVDFTARYGGEEFAILAPQTEKKNASVLATRLLDLVSKEEFLPDGSNKVTVTVSIGLTTFKDDADSKDALIQYADKALSQAKKLGKNRVCLFGT
jgi:two-component system cell cycle response regulator